MATLTGKKIKDTYDGLLKTEDSQAINTTFKTITDGVGNTTALQLNDDEVKVNGDLQTTGKLGVGIVPLNYKLDVNGTARFSEHITLNRGTNQFILRNDDTGYLKISGGTTSNSGAIVFGGENSAYNGGLWFSTGNSASSKMLLNADGELGINTTNPSEKLHVNGNIKGNGTLSLDGNASIGEQTTNSIALLNVGQVDVVGTNVNSLGTPTSVELGELTTFDIPVYIKQNDGNAITIDTSRQVGVGTSSPSQKFHVSGNARITGAIYDSNNSAGTSEQVLTSTGTGTQWADNISQSAVQSQKVIISVKNVSGGSLAKGTVVHAHPTISPPSGGAIEVVAAENDNVDLMPSIGILNETLADEAEGEAVMFGLVTGIDTSAFSIGDELFVSDTAGAFTNTKPTGTKFIQKIAVVIKSHATNGSIQVFGAGRTNDVPTPLYIDHTNQRLGINTSEPSERLEVYNGSALIKSNDNYGLTIDGWGELYGSGIQFAQGETVRANIQSNFDGSTGATMVFDAGTSNSEVMRIHTNNNVGINDTNPSEKLSVGGNIAVTGTVDGVDIAAFKTAYDSHNHDDTYYTESESDSRFVNVTGDTMTGALIVDNSIKFDSQLATNTTSGASRAFIHISSGNGSAKFKVYKNTSTTDGYARIKIDRAFDYGNNDQMVQEAIYQRRVGVKNVKFRYDGDITTTDDVYLEFYELTDGTVEAWICHDDYAQSMVTIFYYENTGNTFPEPTSGTPTGTLIHSTNPDTETPNWESSQGNATFNGDITVSGTVDGRDVANDGTKLDGIESGANNYTHPTHDGDDIDVDTGELTGATVISDLDFNVTTDTLGHVTDANATYSTRNLTASDVGAAASSHTHDDRYYTESEIQTYFNRGYITAQSATNLAVGWYTIATNTGDRALGEFQIWDVASGRHQSVLFNASHHFGSNGSNDITVLANSRYSTDVFRYIRIKDGGTYDGAALQIYIDNATNSVNVAITGANAQVNGWVLKDWIADGTDPGDVDNYSSFAVACQVDLDNIQGGGIATTGGIFSGGATTQYRNLTTADEGSGNGLDADTLDGNHASSFLGATAKAADSNLLDGIDSASFVRSDQDDTLYGSYIIDASSADRSLSLSADGGNRTSIKFYGDTSNYDYWIGHNEANSKLEFGTGVTAGSSVKMVLDNDKLGIGTSSPSDKLDISDGKLRFTNTTSGRNSTIGMDDNYNFYVKNTSAGNLYIGNGTTTFVNGNLNADSGTFYVNASSNKVGVGTVSPAFKLEVEGDDNLLQLSTASGIGQPYMSFAQAGTQKSFIGHVYTGDMLKIASQYGGIKLFTGTNGTESEKMTILSGGNVGIGTTSPNSKFHLKGDAVDNVGLAVLENDYASGGIYFPALSVINTRANHSYGIVSEFRTNTSTDSDRPSILFYGEQASHSWQVGQVTSGWGTNDSFAIGYRASNDPTTFNSWPTAYFTVTNGGNVGIGTTSPSAKLNISGTGAGAAIDWSNITATTGRSFRWVSLNAGGFAVEDLTAGGANRLTINSSGNVGIGTTSPSQKLHLQNGVLLIDTNTATSSGLWMPDTNGNPSLRIVLDQASAHYASIINAWGNSSNAGVTLGTTRNDGFAFQVRSGVTTTSGFANNTGNNRFCVLGNGNVGINDTTPTYKLDVNGTFRVTSNSYLANTYLGANTYMGGGTDKLWFAGDYDDIYMMPTGNSYGELEFYSSGGTRFMHISPDGLGIGDVSPSYQLELEYDSAAKPSSIYWDTVSDERVKTNIQDTTKGLDEINQLRVVTYDYNGKGGFSGDNQIGLVAQEVANVFPEAVGSSQRKLEPTDEEKTEIYNLKFQPISMALIKAVQELSAKVETLESRIQTLETQLNN